MSDLNLLRPECLRSVRDSFGIHGDLQLPAENEMAIVAARVPAPAGAPPR